MNLAIRIAAAILSVPPDVLAPMVPPMAPRPRNALESQLRNEVDSALSGSCSSASADAPLFAISREEARHVDCKSGMPAFMERSLYDGDEEDDDGDAARPAPSTYGEITVLGVSTRRHEVWNLEPKMPTFVAHHRRVSTDRRETGTRPGFDSRCVI